MAQFYSFFGSLIRFFELELKDKMLFESVNGSQSTDHIQLSRNKSQDRCTRYQVPCTKILSE